MKYIIWNYQKGKYIEDENQVVIEYDKASHADKIIHMLALMDVETGKEKNLIEAKENGYMIETI